MSVSSRKPKKKRNPDPASWRTKLDEEGLQYLDEYRRAKLEAADLSSRNWLSEMIGRVRATSNPSNESEGCAKAIDYSVEILPVADIANIILTALEQEGPRGRKALALLAAIPIHWLWSSY
jgi:hypothetical protein